MNDEYKPLLPPKLAALGNEFAGDLELFAERLVRECCTGLYTKDAMDVFKRFGIEYVPAMKKVRKGTDLMTVEDFKECVECGMFYSDDGAGYWATDTHESNLSVWRITRPSWATHVTWYNK